MRIIDRYIGKILLRHIVVTIVVLLGLFTFVSFIEELSDLDRGRYGILQVIQYVILTIPKILYEVFPMAALIGSILGLSTLARDSELIVMRAAGISILRIVYSVLKVGVLLAILSMFIGEVVAPYTEHRAIDVKAESIVSNSARKGDFGVWLRDDNTYVHIGEVLPGQKLRLLNIKIFEFDNLNFLRFLSTAREGEYQQAQVGSSQKDRWLLKGLRRTMINEESSAADEVSAAYWSTVLDPETIRIYQVKPEQLSIWQLLEYIAHLRLNKQDPSTYELEFWSKIVTPFATLVMLILAVPFVFKDARSGNLGRSLFSGIMVGLSFFIANQAFSFFVTLFGIPPILGAALPTMVVALVSFVMIRRIV
jgi:lipopolysaccharide export system permease protein